MRKTTSAVIAAAAAMLAATGAAGSGCSSNDGQTSQQGGQPGGACSLYTEGPQHAGKGAAITAEGISTCSKAVTVHNMTVILERRDAGGLWSEVKSKDFDRAPALNAQKKANLSAPCEPGVYRTKLRLTVQLVSSDTMDGPATAIDNRVLTLGTDDC